MSGFVSEPTRSDEEQSAATWSEDKDGSPGQRHDRMPVDRGSSISMTHDEMKPETEISAGQKMLSAVSGSLLTSLLVTPLDVVRVRLQSQPNSSSSISRPPPSTPAFNNLPPNLGVTACCREVFWVNNNAQFCIASTPSSMSALAPDCAVENTRSKTFTSTLDGLRKIARNEGLPSLWRGLSPTLVMAIPANVIYFTGYDYLRTSTHSPIATFMSDAYAPLVAGSVARVAAASVISPIEMFRTRLQATSGHSSSSGTGVFKDTLLGLKDLVKTQGYTSLWRGLTLTMWRDVPFSGIYWWGYEASRNLLTDMRVRMKTRAADPFVSEMKPGPRSRRQSQGQENHTATFVDSFGSGALSGAVAAVVTTPFDVGKTRQQVVARGDYTSATDAATGSSHKQIVRPEDRSMPRFLYHIWTEEGAAGLFRGWAARCLKVAPACAIMISSYEIGKKMARGVNERREVND